MIYVAVKESLKKKELYKLEETILTKKENVFPLINLLSFTVNIYFYYYIIKYRFKEFLETTQHSSQFTPD